MKYLVLGITLVFSHLSWAQDIAFSSIITGYSRGALESTVVDQGSWFAIRQPVHQAIYIRHPKGDLLYDSGLGERTVAALEEQPWLDRQLLSVKDVSSVKAQLTEVNLPLDQIKGIIPSHLHWDHTGGLPDLAGIPVWGQAAGIEYALNKGDEPAFLKAHLVPEILWQPIELSETPYMGFQRSMDIYQDGSLVLVGLEGHTPGQLGLFINLPDGRRYFFIGDTTWTMTGVEDNLPRPALAQWLLKVDHNLEKNNQHINRIHQLHKQYPELVIVPAHDQFVVKTLPQFPIFSNGQSISSTTASPVVGITAAEY